MRYIVATDYDGTLNIRGKISERTVDAIKTLRSQGHLFGVVSGRDYVNGYAMFKRENLFPFDFVISHNGAAACDTDGNILFAHTVGADAPWGDTTLAKAVVTRCLELTGGPCGVAFEKTRLDFCPESLTGEPKPGFCRLGELGGITEFVLINAICDTEGRAAEVTDALKREFGALLDPIQNGRCIDISAKGVDKASGIARYAELADVAPHNIYTAGDNYNDLPMITKYHGCAIATGVPALVRAAEHVCDSVADVIDIVLSKK